MKIGIFVTEAKYPVNTPSTISGHVQVPLFTANILEKLGHSVVLITNKAPAGYQVPSIVSKKLSAKTVDVVSVSKKWPDQGLQLLKVPLFIYELRKLIVSLDFDVIHFFGTNRAAYLLGLFKAISLSLAL